MPKQSKSSATSATRKKHARKAGPEPNLPTPKNRDASGKKLTKAEKAALKNQPKQKMYIPPKKPAPPQIDPLDGLESQLPGDLVVVLRGLGKKAGVTKARSLEELNRTWIKKASAQDDESKYALMIMAPVWTHHFPTLVLHHDRRIRMLAAQTHSDLLRISEFRESLMEADIERIQGSWILAAHDPERAVASVAMPALSKFDSDKSDSLQFLIQTAFDPLATYIQFNPPPNALPPKAHPPARKGQKSAPPLPPKEVEEREKEEDSENIEDRKARIRSSAVSALGWLLDSQPNLELNEDLKSSLSSPLFWSCLHQDAIPPWLLGEEVEGFGHSQPLVRRAAWSLVSSLLKRKDLIPEDAAPLLSVAVLRSCFQENDPSTSILALSTAASFIKEFPNAWTLDASFKYPDTDEDHHSEGNESENEGGDGKDQASTAPNSPAFDTFLAFLQLGCNGTPIRGYPVVVLIVDSIPAEIFDVGRLFSSLYSALPARALLGAGDVGRRSGNAWLKAYLECTALVARKSSTLGISDPNSFVGEHMKILWHAVSGEEENPQMAANDEKVAPRQSYKLLVDETQAAKDFAWGVKAIGDEYLSSAWSALERALLDTSLSQPPLVCRATAVISTSFEQASQPILQQAAANLKSQLVHQGVSSFENEIPETQQSGLRLLATLLETFGNDVFSIAGEDVIERVDMIMLSQSQSVISSATPSNVFKQFLLAYLSHRNDEARCNSLWRRLLSAVGSVGELELLVELEPIPSYLTPEGSELDQVVGTLVEQVLNGASGKDVVTSVLSRSELFLSEATAQRLFSAIIQTFIAISESATRLQVSASDQIILQASLEMIDSVLSSTNPRASALLQDHDKSLSLIPSIFAAGWILSLTSEVEGRARKIFKYWNDHLGSHADSVQEAIVSTLRSYISDHILHITPESVVTLFYDPSRPSFLTTDTLVQRILPSKDGMNVLLLSLPSVPIDPSLAITNPTIPPTTLINKTIPKSVADVPSYTRMLRALLHSLYQDRARARESLWALQHILAYELYAGDWLSIPKDNGVFDSNVDPSDISERLEKAKVLSTYMISAAVADAKEGWRSGLVDDLIKGQRPSRNALSDFLGNMIQASTEADSVRESRILGTLLDRLLDDVQVDEADKWVVYARKIEKSAPLAAIAIIHSVTRSGAEPPRLDRYRNEIAASLLGIRANRSRTEGTVALWKLAASAPSPDSEVVLIPQPRAVNVMKACQSWISEEDDDNEGDDEGELESVMTIVFSLLAPILQGVPGQHWDFMFDVIESNLESSSLSEDTTLVSLARTLGLITVIQDLAATNKSLRADWKEREVNILTLVRDLAATPLPHDLIASVPRSRCRELVLALVQSLPPSLIDYETLPKMCHLLDDPSAQVQSLAYHLLKAAAQKRTEHLVVEAGVDTDATFVAELPTELVQSLQVHLEVFDNGHDHKAFGHLLSWMITFDLFDHASFKVRSGYIAQLRSLDLVWSHFIPNILGLLGLDKTSQPLKLDLWAVDAFYIEHYDPEEPQSLMLLAAHLYYRALTAVPSLIHSWILDCKDRRLSMTIANYTSSYFSPVLISGELAHLKDPEQTTDLQDENLTVKVYSAANEVVASYAVDEHQLEIRLKIPNDWPLHKMEVKEVKRVGVDAERWRSWILAVQQTVWSHNGHIVDALSLFKKNVTLHFQGQVECAICYSIISVMDGSLPRKPCKTCKNKFHSSCLLKWFNTSHSSSCPLCRSDIL